MKDDIKNLQAPTERPQLRLITGGKKEYQPFLALNERRTDPFLNTHFLEKDCDGSPSKATQLGLWDGEETDK